MERMEHFPADNIAQIFHQTHGEALQKNFELSQEWTKKHEEYLTLLSFLQTLPNTLTCKVMVPIGKKALMRGKIVHTNEILVNLGDGWFVKQSAKLASEICSRRIQLCSEMLSNLEKEHTLLSSRRNLLTEQNPFANEIIEPYDEELEAHWRERHREKEKSHRQELGRLRNRSRNEVETPIPTDDELWNKLDQLELQEELETELERLNAQRSNTKKDISIGLASANPISKVPTPKTNLLAELEVSSEVEKPKRRVSFANLNEISMPNENNEDNEPYVIEFSHSQVQIPIVQSKADAECTIESPRDIYNLFPKTVKKSILKQSRQNNSDVRETEAPATSEVLATAVLDTVANRRDGVVLRDVTELVAEEQAVCIEPSRPVSRFKAARMAATSRANV